MTEHTWEGIEKALAYGSDTHTVGDVIDQILRGDAMLWEDLDALIVTEIHNTPRKKVVHFWLATGAMAAVVRLSYRVLEWAQGEGCTLATLSGRRGWARALKGEGWHTDAVLMHQEI